MFVAADVTVEVVEGATATVAHATSRGFAATGEAKCCPGDEFDTDVGRTLAVGRALVSLGEVMEDYAIKRSHLVAHH